MHARGYKNGLYENKNRKFYFKNEIFEKRKTISCESFGNVVRKIVPGA